MDDMGRVADKGETLGDERARNRKPERKHATRPDRRDVTEMQAETPLELGVKLLFRQRDDARCLFRPLGPNDRRSMPNSRVALQRQDRERTGGKEMLLGTPVVIPLVRDGRHNGRLTVAEAVGGDARAFADRRMRAVRGDEKPRGERIAVGQRDVDVVARTLEAGDRRLPQGDAFVLRLLHQCGDERGVLDHVGERLARFDVAVEGEKDRPHDVAEAAIGHDHVENGLRLDVLPHADSLEQPPRRGDDCGGAGIFRRPSQRRVGHRDGERGRQALAQRNGQRQTGKAGAADQHIGPLHAPCRRGHARPPGQDYSIVIARSRGR
jgi:hypothetical protein